MEAFKLDKAKGTLKKCTTAKGKSKEDGHAVLTNDVSLLIVVDERSEKGIEHLFPGFSHVENLIAARDGDYAGLEMQTNAKPDELNATIFDGGGTNEIFKFERVGLNGKPKLLVNSLGDSRLALRLDARLTKKDMSKLVDYIEADIYVTCEVAQPQLPGIVVLTPSKPKEEEADDDEPETTTEPIQQTLDGSMTAEELRTLREGADLTRTAFIDALEEVGCELSARSLGRYESGERIIPDDVAAKTRALFAPQ